MLDSVFTRLDRVYRVVKESKGFKRTVERLLQKVYKAFCRGVGVNEKGFGFLLVVLNLQALRLNRQVLEAVLRVVRGLGFQGFGGFFINDIRCRVPGFTRVFCVGFGHLVWTDVF